MNQLPPRTSFEYRRDGRTIERAFLCPVCEYPTIYEPGGYEICDLCSWEDDDFDRGGPNGGYTLTEAKQNFRDHLSMYRRSHEISPHVQRPGFPIHLVESEEKRGTITKKKKKIEILIKFMDEGSLDRRGELYQAYLDTE